jgi:hypothetical protein
MDCALLALAMLTGHSYEDILLAAGDRARAPHRKGLFRVQLMAIAADIGIPLQWRRASRTGGVDYDSTTGILDMVCCAHRSDSSLEAPGRHFALLRAGCIFDENDVWPDPDMFIAHYQATIAGIMRVPRSKE